MESVEPAGFIYWAVKRSGCTEYRLALDSHFQTDKDLIEQINAFGDCVGRIFSIRKIGQPSEANRKWKVEKYDLIISQYTLE